MIDHQRRRVRRTSVLLSSYRRSNKDWEHWLHWELLKPILILAALSVPHIAGLVEVPMWLVLAMMAASAIWAAFVVVHASLAFRRLDQRRLALLKAAGVECNLSAAMRDKRLWQAGLQGRTMRDVLNDSSLKPPVD